MSSQLDRLRRLQGLRQQKNRSTPDLPDPSYGNENVHGPKLALEDATPGAEIENHAGRCYVVTQRYGLNETRGPRPLGALLGQTPAALAALHPKFGIDKQRDFLSAAFIDTETTGLGAGAGVYAFMVGVGTFEATSRTSSDEDLGGLKVGKAELSQTNNPNIPNFAGDIPDLDFVVRQFFMRSPAEEGALLVALSELLAPFDMTVTFNGRTFDLPLLRTRFQQNHWLFPAGMDEVALLAPDRAHLDLLHPARRLWRKRLRSCRLINLEARVLGLQRSEDDVPGALIPQLYVDYTRDGNATQMARVFYHNREDIVSMVSLADALSEAFGLQPSAAAPAALPGVDWLALALSLERSGALAEAESAYRHAAATTRQAAARGEAYEGLGRLLKRQTRWDEAAAVWQEWLTSTPDHTTTPYVELSKYCEWQLKEFDQAEMWAAWALHNLESAPPGRQNRVAIAELAHRLARIRRKQQE